MAPKRLDELLSNDRIGGSVGVLPFWIGTGRFAQCDHPEFLFLGAAFPQHLAGLEEVQHGISAPGLTWLAAGGG